ncbi:acyltransferase [Candidatus Woesearchaeota archaeon]|jgi:maltose O-acetyltransferase|nr:acyltransferase [Candidatus Woesearchaeota archaeon]
MTLVQKITKIKILNKVLGNLYLGLRLFYQEMKCQEFRKKYDLHPTFRFNGPNTIFYGDGNIEGGKSSHIGRSSAIYVSKGNKVTIGENCSISHYVTMYTESKKTNQDFSIKPHQQESGDIMIGNHSWIGVGVFIKHGVKIGKNCIIGANSVVTKDIPDYSIAVGAPARVVKEISTIKQ